MQPCRHNSDPRIGPRSLRHVWGVRRDNKHQGWQQLAGLFLSITGAEALYADLGHFNKTAIRVSLALDLLKACRPQEASAAADICCSCTCSSALSVLPILH